jgi:hypothetical protein
MDKSKIGLQSFNLLKSYCENQNFEGWDPYDGLNSSLFQSIPFLSKNKWIRLAWIQFFKRSFINFRPIAGVKKGLNPKGVALFISAYCNLTKVQGFGSSEIKTTIKELSSKLIQLNSPGFSGMCWGYNFDWQSRAFFQPKLTPTIVVTTYAANALLDAYEILGDENFKKAAFSSGDFILSDLNRTYNESGNFVFSYSPYDKTSVFNASLLGARLLSRIYAITKEEKFFFEAKKAVSYCCNYQNTDGSWHYSPLPFHQWIDNFHTGFNLECISDYIKNTGDTSFSENFNKGLKYYLTTFFDEEGRAKYYNNSLYPVDIHAPAQLIVTLSKTGLFDSNRELIDRVTTWTIQNMQGKKGYFYYQKHKFYTNKIAYMRWSQAWIFYGLSHYLLNTNRLYK